MLVTEKMSSQLHYVSPDDNLQSVYARMIELKVRHMLVIDACRLVGILSDRDMLLFAKPGYGYLFPDGRCVRDVMAQEVIKVSPDASLDEVAKIMLELRIDAVPILRSDGHIMGVVTATDLIQLIADRTFEPPRVPLSNDSSGAYASELCEDLV